MSSVVVVINVPVSRVPDHDLNCVGTASSTDDGYSRKVIQVKWIGDATSSRQEHTCSPVSFAPFKPWNRNMKYLSQIKPDRMYS